MRIRGVVGAPYSFDSGVLKLEKPDTPFAVQHAQCPGSLDWVHGPEGKWTACTSAYISCKGGADLRRRLLS